MPSSGPDIGRNLIVRLAVPAALFLAVALSLAMPRGSPLAWSPWNIRGGVAQFHSWRLPDAAIRAVILGQIPDDQPRGGVRLIEVEDQTPDYLDPSNSAAFWTVWRADPAAVDGMLLRALHFTADVTTPQGTFFMQVEPFVLARTPGDGREGLLAFVAFDPTQPGKPEDSLPDVFTAARQASLLTLEQHRALVDRQAAYEGRVADLLDAWGRFAESPRDEAIREAFLGRLAGVRAAPYLSPEEFFAADQRVRLRGLGHQIRGRITHDYRGVQGVRYTIVIRDCPLSQIADAWNGGASALTMGMEPAPRPAIQVRQDLRGHEANLEVPIPMMGDTPQTRVETVLRALLTIDGVSLASLPTSDPSVPGTTPPPAQSP